MSQSQEPLHYFFPPKLRMTFLDNFNKRLSSTSLLFWCSWLLVLWHLSGHLLVEHRSLCISQSPMVTPWIPNIPFSQISDLFPLIPTTILFIKFPTSPKPQKMYLRCMHGVKLPETNKHRAAQLGACRAKQWFQPPWGARETDWEFGPLVENPGKLPSLSSTAF